MSSFTDRLTWFGTPVAVTVGLHLLVLTLLLVRWANPATIEARTTLPVAIKATLVDAASLQPKKKPHPQPQPKPKSKPKPRPKPKPVAQQTPAKAEPEPEVIWPIPEPARETPPEKLAAETLNDIESALASEQFAQSGKVGSVSDTVAAVIKQAVVGRWTRPPSARNGMIAILEIALVPTGDVVGVTVLESSGNVAFDRSAMNAVDKVARFPEVKSLDRAIFERDFRRFQLLFRPEDLRY